MLKFVKPIGNESNTGMIDAVPAVPRARGGAAAKLVLEVREEYPQ